tara:strand:- start:118 stop:579 length:462 start_codon:yes stop_codon:yes gene_type:complete
MAGTSNYSPYEPNSKGFTEALIDLKDTLAGRTVYSVAGFESLAFENVAQGQPLYARSSDGKLGLARAAGSVDEARVVGFAQTSKSTGETVRCLVFGNLETSGLNAGELYFLSTGYGGITTTAPSSSGQFITRVGESISSASLHVSLEPPIKVS